MMRVRAYVMILAVLLAVPAAAQQPSPAQDAAGLPVLNQPVSVQDAVTVALRNSPTVAARQAAAAAASARVGMAKAMTRPQVSATTIGTAGNMPMIVPGPDNVEPRNFGMTPDTPRLTQNVMAMYPLYTGGRLQGQLGSARALQEASSSDTASVEFDAALAVRTAYYQVLLARRFAEAYQQRVDEAAERVRIAQESFEAGRIAKFDVLRNQTELAEARQQLNNAQRDVETATIDLKSAMGISQESVISLTSDLEAAPQPQSLAELQAMALKQRPELTAARARLRSAEAAQRVARSAYKPQVYATAMAELSLMKNGGMDDNTESGYLVGVVAALPIFDAGLRESGVEEAQAMVRQMQADEREAVLSVTRSVAAAFAQLDAATKNASLAQAAIAQADEDYKVIRLRYEAGKATNVEVLDALASLTRARTGYAEALYTQNVARETLARAVGQR